MILEPTSSICVLSTRARLGHQVCVLELIILEGRGGALGTSASVERHLVELVQVDTLDDIDLTLVWPIITY